MRVVVVGATGNVGTSVVQALADDPGIDAIIGLARRRPALALPKVEWRQADIAGNDLAHHFEGADAVIHLAWLIQPSHDLAATEAVNVRGSVSLFEAAAEAKVPAILYASSVGAYSTGPKDGPVDESWPTDGISTSFYSRHKAVVERALDDFEEAWPDVRVVRMRPALIFKADAATEIRRLFAGPFLPSALVRRSLIPVVPDLPRLRFQVVHSADVGEAFRLAAKSDARGAFNLAAAPVLDPPRLARMLGARRVAVSDHALRRTVELSWRLHLQPTPAGWLDLALGVPVMDASRAQRELGWAPTRGAEETLSELLDGIRAGAGYPTPPLDPASSGPMRVNELRTGVGSRAF
jgi:nucleoside-diphosphate-sugar epimerase